MQRGGQYAPCGRNVGNDAEQKVIVALYLDAPTIAIQAIISTIRPRRALSTIEPLRHFFIHVSDWDISDIDNESVPICSIDGDSEANSILVLVKSDATDLGYLDMSVCRKVEICSLAFVWRSPSDLVMVSDLLDTKF